MLPFSFADCLLYSLFSLSSFHVSLVAVSGLLRGFCSLIPSLSFPLIHSLLLSLTKLRFVCPLLSRGRQQSPLFVSLRRVRE